MKDMKINEWQKECRFLYNNLKELYEQVADVQIDMISEEEVSKKDKSKMIDTAWNVYCIEKNIKPEDYEL